MLKILCLFFSVSFLVLINACVAMMPSRVTVVGSTPYMRPAGKLLSPNSEQALVRFLRSGQYLYSTIDFVILDGEKVIGNVPVNTQFGYLTDPGKHLFISLGAGIDPFFLEAELVSEKTYYIMIGPNNPKSDEMNDSDSIFKPVKRGSELWNKIKDYEKSLKRLEPNKELLKKWEEAKKSTIKKLPRYYETYLKDAYNWSRLNPEDGR